MNILTFRCAAFRRLVAFGAGLLLLTAAGHAAASDRPVNLPRDATAGLHYLLDLAKKGDGRDFDTQRIASLITFLQSSKPAGSLYSAGDSFDAPSAYHDFTIDIGLTTIIGYTLDKNIPSFFFWPSSLRLSRWTRVVGGDEQFARMRSASVHLVAPFVFKGSEHQTITPDQHTGAYYSYDVDKMVILSPYCDGKLMISIYRQQQPSAVGKRGWVLGKDDDWSYLYTDEKGLNLKGLGWASTYMYDSYGISIYYQPDVTRPKVICGVVSWVRAGWAGINMVQPKYIRDGLVRVARAFTEIIENPRLPAPASLAETFSKSKGLSTPTLRKYVGDYLADLKQRISSSKTLWKKVGPDFDKRSLLKQMDRDELYSVVALDYFKKLLGRNPVMESHPF
jgi:hypothetical protein